MSRSGVYEICNTTNGNRYVGSAVNLKKRLRYHRRHLRSETHGNAHLQNAWNKHGEEIFEFRTLLYCDEDMLLAYEQLAINQKSEYNLYKIAGSPLGTECSPETRAKLSKANMGHEVSAETRAKIGAAHRGRKLSDEHKAKLGAASKGRNKGRKLSKEHRERIGVALRGHKHSKESRANMSAAHIGKQTCLGYKHTAEARANMSAAHKGKPWSAKRRAAYETSKESAT